MNDHVFSDGFCDIWRLATKPDTPKKTAARMLRRIRASESHGPKPTKKTVSEGRD